MTDFATLLALDEALSEAGFPPLSEWWRREFQRFYEHPTARTWGARVGRGGAKSTALVKHATCETLFGDWVVPPGERHYFCFVSLSRDEAAQRLRLLEAYLTALGERYSRAGEVIDLDDSPRGFRVFSCTVGGTSGFRCFGAAADEVAKWRSADTNANPADEVITSVRAMMVTHPGARLAAFSSPFGLIDWHAKIIDEGDGERQVVSKAPTWVANPVVSEEQTRALEPDERKWRREYAAIPQAGALGAFDADAIGECFEAFEPGQRMPRALIIDASSGKKDSWTWGVAGWNVGKTGRRVFTFELVDGIDGKFWGQLTGDQVVAKLAQEARRRGVRVVHGDQRESMMLKAAFMRHGMRFVEHPWGGPSKERAVELVRSWMRDRRLALPEHERLHNELLMFEERVSPSGGFTFGARGSGHDDYVALLLTAAMADAGGHFRGSAGVFNGAPNTGGVVRGSGAYGGREI